MKHSRFSSLAVLLRACLVVAFLFSLGSPAFVQNAAAQTAFPPPPSPVPLTPANGATVYSTAQAPRALPTFTWAPVPGAKQYYFQVSTSQGFEDSNLLYKVYTNNPAYVPVEANLPDNLWLFWRVKVFKDINNVEGPFSDDQTFYKAWTQYKKGDGTIIDNAPQLISPAPGAELAFNDPATPTDRPSFSWTAVPGATYYSLQLSLDSAFTSLEYNYSTQATTYQFAMKPPDNTYYWRVVPNANGKVKTSQTDSIWVGTPSDSRTVTFNYNSSYIPQPIEPISGVTVNFTPTLRWTTVRGAQYYVIQISTSESWSGVPEVRTYATSYTPPIQQKNDQTYFWRVRAVSGESDTPTWSATMSYRKKWYIQPITLTPVEGHGSTIEPFFTWTPVEGAIKYRLELSPDQNFSTIRTYETTNTVWVPSNFDCTPFAGNKVFWRVVPIDKSGDTKAAGFASDPANYDCNFASPSPVLVYPRYFYTVPAENTLNPYEDLTVPLPAFQWKRLLKTDGSGQQHLAYRIQVNENGIFMTGVPPKWSFDTENMNAIPKGISSLPDGTYFWRVAALAAKGDATPISPWSQIWKVNINRSRLPAGTAAASPTQLLRPVHGTEWDETVPLFEWRPVATAVKYRIQVSTSPYTSNLENAEYLKVNEVVDYPAYSHPNRLPYGTYYWRVQALDGNSNPLAGGWSALFRFQVAAQSRFRSDRSGLEDVDVGTNDTPVIGSDPVGDMTDPNYDLSTLAVTQDPLHWYFNFAAAPGAANMRYMLYIDTDHKDNSGATFDPEGYNVKAIAGHLPEYAISVWQMNGTFNTDQVIVYGWNQTSKAWSTMNQLSALTGGMLAYKNGKVEIRIRGANLDLDEYGSTAAVVVFSGKDASGQAQGHAQDTVPSDPAVNYTTPDAGTGTTTLSRFVTSTGRVSIIYPGNTPTNDTLTYWSPPALSFHAPVETDYCMYGIRIATDPAMTTLLSLNPSTFPPHSTYTLASDLGDNMYYWQVQPYYWNGSSCTFKGGYSEANVFMRKGPSVKGLKSTVEYSQVRLEWTSTEGADNYDLMIDDDPSFSCNPNCTLPLTTTAVNRATPPTAVFENGVTYYWRVRADQTYMSGISPEPHDAWSATGTFQVKRGVPTGLYTIPGTDVKHASSTNPTLCWTPVNGAYQYGVQIAYDDQFNTLYGLFWTEQRCYTVTSPTRDGAFYWRVAVEDGQLRQGEYSSPAVYNKEYGKPTPLSPLGDVHGTPIFKWSPVQGANKYHLEILNPETNAVIFKYDTAATQFMPLIDLKLRTYKWRVAMMDYNKKPGPNYGPNSDEVLIQDPNSSIFLPMLVK